MWHWNVRKDQGFTLIEIITVVIIIGIVAAIAAPNLLGLLNRNRVNQGLTELEGAINEAQRQAIRNGKSCTVTLNTSNKTITNKNSTDGCLLTSRNLDKNLDIKTSLPDNGTANNHDIAFSGKGNTDPDSKGIFVIYMSDGTTDQQKCLVIENTLGTMRTGDYDYDEEEVPETLNTDHIDKCK